MRYTERPEQPVVVARPFSAVFYVQAKLLEKDRSWTIIGASTDDWALTSEHEPNWPAALTLKEGACYMVHVTSVPANGVVGPYVPYPPTVAAHRVKFVSKVHPVKPDAKEYLFGKKDGSSKAFWTDGLLVTDRNGVLEVGAKYKADIYEVFDLAKADQVTKASASQTHLEQVQTELIKRIQSEGVVAVMKSVDSILDDIAEAELLDAMDARRLTGEPITAETGLNWLSTVLSEESQKTATQGSHMLNLARAKQVNKRLLPKS